MIMSVFLFSYVGDYVISDTRSIHLRFKRIIMQWMYNTAYTILFMSFVQYLF